MNGRLNPPCPAVLLLFMVLNSHQISPNFLVCDGFIPRGGLNPVGSAVKSPDFLTGLSRLQIWLLLCAFLMATAVRMCAACQQLHAQAQAHAAAAASGILGHADLRLQMPPPAAFAASGRHQGLRLQLALLDRDFDDLGVMASSYDFQPDGASVSKLTHKMPREF